MASMLKSMGGLVVMMTWLAACGGDSQPDGTMMLPSTTGSLRVTVVTTGEDLDSDGYQVRVGAAIQSVGLNGSVVFPSLAGQSHTVTLEGLSTNCSTSNNPRAVGVTAGSDASTTFTVVCEAVRTTAAATEEASDSLGEALYRIINQLDDVSSLDGLSFEPARDLYQEALDLDPDNQNATFGLAIATIFLLEDDPDLRAIADQWESWLDTHELDDLNGVSALAMPGPVLWKRGSLPLDPTGVGLARLVGGGEVLRGLIAVESESGMQAFPPTPAEHQELLLETVAPALSDALDLLEMVDDPNFVFEVTPAMQGEDLGEADTLELDHTEVLLLRAGLDAALAGIGVATAYRTEPSPWGAQGFTEAMESGSTFATLAPEGAGRLADAHSRLGEAVDLLRDALTSLENEADDQDNDVIKYDPGAPGGGFEDEYVGSEGLADARELLDDVDASLAGPRMINVDLGLGEVDIVVDLSRFFLTPIPDLKALLPAYHVADGSFFWEASTFEEWVFPDPTLNGILPGMGSSEELKNTIELDGLFEEFAAELVLSTTSLPDGEMGSPYSATLTATGGDSDYAWSLTSGELPQGLTLDPIAGEISGTPTAVGTWEFTVEVMSEDGSSANRLMSIRISAGGGGTGLGADQFVLIPAGSFQMGDITGNGHSSWELPVHTVNITQSFYMQKTEVTQGQWLAVMGSNQSNFHLCGNDCPVERVSWIDIQAFLSALNAQDPGKNYRLPTEAEWEYAARAGTMGDYGGTDVLDDMGWYADNIVPSYGLGPHPVAQKLPNAWGLHDMHGNVQEWVQDRFSPSYYSVSPTDDPTGPAIGSLRVVRGGSWLWGASFARSAFRTNSDPGRVVYDIGFRLARATGEGAPVPTITTSSPMPDGVLGIVYSQTLAATGGATPYTWSISAGTLPAGLGIDSSTGVISGTPTSSGTSTFSARVADANGLTDTQVLSIAVGTAVILQPSDLCGDYSDFAIATFEDADLEAAVRQALSVGAQEDLACGSLANLRDLTARSLGIVSLVGIQNLTGLEGLFLSNNAISEILPLSNLSNLTRLELSWNALGDIGPLGALTRLTFLNLEGNRTINDISSLSGLKSLTTLYLHQNSITDISVLKRLTSLTSLSLSANLITDISVLGDLTGLTTLGLAQNLFTNISVLSGLTSLTTLGLGYNSISDLSVLSSLTSLTSLQLSRNNITNINPLSGLTSLTTLTLDGNTITDISVLSGLTNLTILWLLNNVNLSNIQPLIDNTGLGAGDAVDLRSTSVSCPDVAALRAKGVTVTSPCS